jgi:hypothetical protein
MRSSVFTAAVVVTLACTAAAEAQFRSGLTSATATRPGAPSLPIQSLPIAWSSNLIALPEAGMQSPPPLAEGAPTGGLQLDVLPWSAQVYVDGALAGRVEQFRGYYRPLTLGAGPHVITLVAPDREPLIFAITIVPARTITHRATLAWAGASWP